MLLKSLSLSIVGQRFRATYHKQNSSWIARKSRRFFLQYPRSPLYAILGVCCAGFFFPYMKFTYKFLTLSSDDFLVYRDHYNAVVRERQKHGTSLYIPFFTTNKAENPTDTS